MMKRLVSFIFVFTAFPSSIWGQTSIEAKNLLELASKQMEAYDNIQFDFTYVLNNRMEKITQERTGQVTVANDKYKLNFLDAIQIFDGLSLFTIVPENEEITIAQKEEDEEFGINPKKLLRFYREGYDYHWDISQRVKGRNIQFVKLIPTQEEDQDILSILIGIDIMNNHIYRLIEVGDNGTTTTLTINNMDVNTSLPDDYFVFKAADYPDYYINN